MPDMGLMPDERLLPGDRAVKYLLDRIQHDPDLRHVCGPRTQSWALLIEAEAARTGERPDAVEERRRVNKLPAHHEQRPEVVILRERVEELERQLRKHKLDIDLLRLATRLRAALNEVLDRQRLGRTAQGIQDGLADAGAVLERLEETIKRPPE